MRALPASLFLGRQLGAEKLRNVPGMLYASMQERISKFIGEKQRIKMRRPAAEMG